MHQSLYPSQHDGGAVDGAIASGEHTPLLAVHALLAVVGLVELTSLIGYYTMLAISLNAHELSLPPGVEPPLPPRAR